MANTSSITSGISEIRGQMATVLSGAAEVLAGLEPADLPTSLVPALLDQFVTLERLGGAGRMLLAAKAVESERWRRDGFATPADWLAAKQGCGPGRARDDLATSGRLGTLDDTTDALRHGLLSPDQAGAVADAAAVNPDAEADLIGTAQHESLKHLRDEAARRKAEREDLAKKEQRIHKRRSVRRWVDRDGVWHQHTAGLIAAGSAYEIDLEPWIRQQFDLARKQDRHEGREQHAFDALMAMARFATDHLGHRPPANLDDDPGDHDNPGGSDSPGDSGDPAGSDAVPDRPRHERLRHLALLRVDFQALTRGTVNDGELCEIAGLGPISIPAARELLGDSILKLLITNGSDVLNVTHLGRGPNVAQDVALLWSDPVCVVEGCNRTIRLEADHAVGWALDRVTRLGNLRKPCKYHHDLKTLHNWDLITGTGRRAMVPPEHPDHPRNRSGP